MNKRRKIVTALLLTLSVLCAVILYSGHFSGYVRATPGEIMHWFPTLGRLWLSVRNGFEPVLSFTLWACLAALYLLNLSKIAPLWAIITVVLISLLIYLMLWIIKPGTLIFIIIALCISIWTLHRVNPEVVSRGRKFVRGRGANIILAVFSVVLTLSLVEVYLRYIGMNASYMERNGIGDYISPYSSEFEKGWYHLHDINQRDSIIHFKEFDYRFATNAEGLVDRAWTVKKQKRRIMCIGDSFTQGIGATGDSTFEHILQSNDDSVEVMNCGVAGSDPVFEYQLFHDRLLKYDPDCVFVFINATDIGDVMARGGFERFTNDGKVHFRKGPWWEFIYAHSYIARLIPHNVYKLNWFFLTEEEDKKARAVAIEELKKCLDSFEELCESKKLRCVFVFHPMRGECQSGVMECEPVKEYAMQQHYEAVDLLDFFQKHGVNAQNAPNYFWPGDGHNNNRGYVLFAEALREGI